MVIAKLFPGSSGYVAYPTGSQNDARPKQLVILPGSVLLRRSFLVMPPSLPPFAVVARLPCLCHPPFKEEFLSNHLVLTLPSLL